MPVIAVKPTLGTVHPRARGEHILSGMAGPSYLRFIPAHAGNICSRSVWYAGRPVHPRARGEHPLRLTLRVPGGGSSPRTRGTCRGAGREGRRPRFIPAHAGNISPPENWWCRNSVHPRARGEHSVELDLAAIQGGSSPRTRGTWIGLQRETRYHRFIPAHAGNMSVWTY